MTTLKQYIDEKTEEQANAHIPESMRDYEFVPIDNIIGKAVCVENFEIFTSKSQKYTSDTAKGIHIALRMENGDKVRICTHSQGIVRMFEMMADDGVTLDESEYIIFDRVNTARGKALIIR